MSRRRQADSELVDYVAYLYADCGVTVVAQIEKRLLAAGCQCNRDQVDEALRVAKKKYKITITSTLSHSARTRVAASLFGAELEKKLNDAELSHPVRIRDG